MIPYTNTFFIEMQNNRKNPGLLPGFCLIYYNKYSTLKSEISTTSLHAKGLVYSNADNENGSP